LPSAEEILREKIQTNPSMLEDALANLRADGYSSAALAMAQDPVLPRSLEAAQAYPGGSAEAWNNWKPGDVDAANLLKDGGFQTSLADTGVTIQGMTDTLYGRMGTALADGAARGDSVDTIAAALGDIIDDPKRAYTIANTELARAISTASRDTYALNGIAQWNWLLSPGACPTCETLAEANPHDIKDEYPPAHPHCRCSSAPIDPGMQVGAVAEDAASLPADNAIADGMVNLSARLQNEEGLRIDLGSRYDSLTSDAQKNIEALLASAPDTVVRVPVDVLEQIIKDGRFKSQFETGSSKGLFLPEFRSEVESSLFNIPDPANFPLKERPIYGYLTDINKADPLVSETASQYGSVALVMNDEARARSTFTLGDSLGGRYTPSSVNDPNFTSAKFTDIADGKTPSDISQYNPKAGDEQKYIETQIHGGLSFSDVKSAVVYEGESPADPGVLALLTDNGVPWKVVSKTTGEVLRTS
jgi:hypothetical protein